jgi:hypothetical protein
MIRALWYEPEPRGCRDSVFARDVGGNIELANLDPHGARVALILPCDAEA